MDKKEQTRLRVQRYRDKQKALHSDGVTSPSVTPQSVTDHRVRHLAESLINPQKRAKLILLSNALNKTITGLDGKPLRLDTMVRYGIGGFLFSEIKELLV